MLASLESYTRCAAVLLIPAPLKKAKEHQYWFKAYFNLIHTGTEFIGLNLHLFVNSFVIYLSKIGYFFYNLKVYL